MVTRFAKAPAALLRLKDKTMVTVVLAHANYADFATGEGARPSISKLSAEIELSTRTIERSIKKAVALGLMVVTTPHDPKKQNPAVYRHVWMETFGVLGIAGDTHVTPEQAFSSRQICREAPDTGVARSETYIREDIEEEQTRVSAGGSRCRQVKSIAPRRTSRPAILSMPDIKFDDARFAAARRLEFEMVAIWDVHRGGLPAWKIKRDRTRAVFDDAGRQWTVDQMTEFIVMAANSPWCMSQASRLDWVLASGDRSGLDEADAARRMSRKVRWRGEHDATAAAKDDGGTGW